MKRAQRYRIREIALLTGIPENAIRFYEKYEIIHPMRGSGNYRFYSETDLLRIMAVRTYRSLGFSLRQCKEMLDSMNHTQRREALGRRLGEVSLEIRRLESVRRNLEDRVAELDEAIALRHDFRLIELPAAYWLFSHEDAGKHVDPARLDARLNARIMEKLPFFRLEGHVSLASLEGSGPFECSWGIALDEGFCRELPREDQEALVFLPAQRCLSHTNLTMGTERRVCREDFRELLAYAEANGLVPCGTARVRLIPGRRQENDYVYQLLQCYLPVADADA